MPHLYSIRRKLRVVLACTAVVLASLLSCAGAAEAAEGYGELTRFGNAGTGPGELAPFASSESPATLGIGVDSSDNSVYVVDEPTRENRKQKEEEEEEQREKEEEEGKEVEITPEEAPLVRQIRLQKFKANGSGKYALAASAEFTEIAPYSPQSEGSSAPTIEGIAVDPKRERVYLLVTDLREKSLAVDPAITAAATLYAFSTKESAGKLIPEGKTIEGVVTPIITGPGAGEFETESVTHGKPLLEPRGITVDPYTGDVIILAHEDAEVSAGKFEDRYALQRVSSSGALGSRYVDKTGFFSKGHFKSKPESPVVAGPESGPSVYVNFEGLAQVPYDFGSTEAPKQIFEEPRGSFEPPLIEYGRRTSYGGALSVSSNGETLFGEAEIYDESDKTLQFGVYERSAANGALIGWTGGQSEKLSHEDECVLKPGVKQPPTPIASGSEGKVFVLATGYLLSPEEEEIPPPPHPAVVELGPGGKGCPQASSGTLQAKASSTELKPDEKIPDGTTVTFLAHPIQADALSIEWEIENVKTHEKQSPVIKSVEAKEYRTPKFSYMFTQPGEYVVTAVMQTDNLASPLLDETPEAEPISFKLTVNKTKAEEEEGEVKKTEEEKAKKAEEEKAKKAREEKEAKEREERIKREEEERPLKEKEARELLELQEAQQRMLAEQTAREASERASREASEAAAATAAKKHQEEEAAAKKKAEEEKAKTTPKPSLTRAQLLAKALKSCKKDPKKKRAVCEVLARKKYGPKPKHKHK
jgi:hypothetical protein